MTRAIDFLLFLDEKSGLGWWISRHLIPTDFPAASNNKKWLMKRICVRILNGIIKYNYQTNLKASLNACIKDSKITKRRGSGKNGIE